MDAVIKATMFYVGKVDAFVRIGKEANRKYYYMTLQINNEKVASIMNVKFSTVFDILESEFGFRIPADVVKETKQSLTELFKTAFEARFDFENNCDKVKLLITRNY